MIKESAQIVCREKGLHYNFRKLHCQSQIRNPLPQFVVVCKVVNDNVKASNGLQFPATERKR